MSDSVRPHRWQPTRLLHPWDSPGKNTGVGCHFFLQCMKVKSESEVAQSCRTLPEPTDCSLPGSSVHGILQARVLEWERTTKNCIKHLNAFLFRLMWFSWFAVLELFSFSSWALRQTSFHTVLVNLDSSMNMWNRGPSFPITILSLNEKN